MLQKFRGKPASVLALAIAVLISAALLAGAHIFEALGYAPCALCLDQREAHWAAIGVSVAGLLAFGLFRAPIAATAAVGAVSLVYLFSAGLSFFHVGVEYEFWPGPATCSGGAGGVTNVDDLTNVFSETVRAPSCTEAQWRFLGVSMAGYNLLFSAGLFALTLAAALAGARTAHRMRRKNFTETGRQAT